MTTGSRSVKRFIRVAARLLGLLATLLLLPTMMVAQGWAIQGQAVDSLGRPLQFAKVRVCPYTASGLPCSPLTPTIWSDIPQTHAITNPYTTDQTGNYSFVVNAGQSYLVQVFAGSLFIYSYLYTAGVTSGVGSGTVTNFSAGNLSPLFTTSVTSPTTTPALAFTLTPTVNNSFLGNFSGSTAVPKFWTLAAGTNVTLVPSGSTLTINATGGGGGLPSGNGFVGVTAGVGILATPGSFQSSFDPFLLSPGPIGGSVASAAAFTSLASTLSSVSGTRASCTQFGPIFGGNACAQDFVVTDTYPLGTVHDVYAHSIVLNTSGPGISGAQLGNRNDVGLGFHNLYTAQGITNEVSSFSAKAAVGDWLPQNWNTFGAFGVSEGSDQGYNGYFQNGGEQFGFPHFTLATGTTGTQAPTFTSTNGSGCSGFGNACIVSVGSTLLRTQASIASTFLNGASTSFVTGCTIALKQLPTTGGLPTTTAWGCVDGANFTTRTTPNLPVSVTLPAFTHGAGGPFSPGDKVVVVGDQHEEQSVVTGVTGTAPNQSITLSLANVNNNIAVFRGGLAGTYASMDGYLSGTQPTGYRTSYAAIGSITGSDWIYATLIYGTVGSYSLPVMGAEPVTTGGGSDVNAGVHFYCGARITTTPGSGNYIEPNKCAWAPGDTAEDPDFMGQNIQGQWNLVNMNYPSLGGAREGGMLAQIGGLGAASSAFGYTIENAQSNAALYAYPGGSGLLTPGKCAYCAGLLTNGAIWQDTLLAVTAPTHAVLDIQDFLPGQTMLSLVQTPGGGEINWNSATDVWEMASGGDQSTRVRAAAFEFNFASSIHLGIANLFPFNIAAIGTTFSGTTVSGYSALATGGLDLPNGDIEFGPLNSPTVTISNPSSGLVQVNGNFEVTGTCTGCGSGTIVASPQHQVPFFSAAGTASTLTGDAAFTDDGSGNAVVRTINGVGSLSGGLISGVQNTSTNAAAYSAFRVYADSSSANFFGFYAFGSNWTPSGLFQPLSVYLGANPPNTAGMFINTETTAPLTLATNYTPAMTISGTTQVATFAAGIIDSAITPGTGAICAHGTSGAFTNVGCATGSGTVTTSGTPTTGFLSLFTGSTVIGNSHLDDGITTASTVTSSETVAAPSFQGTSTTTGPASFSFPFNTGSISTLPTGSTGFAGPSSAGGTAWLGFLNGATAAGIAHAAAPTTIAGVNGSQITWSAVSLTTDVSGNLPNANLATQTANTVLGALTATTPSGLTMPSCSGASNALIWTTSTGFGCNTISGGSSAFSSLTSGTNTAAAMVVGSGASLSASGSGSIIATGASSSGTLALSGTTGITLSVPTGNTISSFINSINTWQESSSANNSTVTLETSPQSAATNVANFNSPAVTWLANYWTGTASANDNWSAVNVSGSGSNPTQTLTFSHAGSSGVALVSVPGLVSTGTTAGFLDLPQGSSSASVSPCSTATSICLQAPTSVTSQLRTFAGTPATGFTKWTNTSGSMVETLVPIVVPVANAISSATGGSGTGTITCLTAACTNMSGTYSIAGGTFTTGTLLALVWPTTTTAYSCWADMNGGTGFLGIGHSVATATGMNITNAVTVLGITVTVDYGCSAL